MTLIEKLRDALSDLQDSYAEIENIIERMETEEDVCEKETSAETVLGDGACFTVSQALGIPEWKVREDFDAAILQLCEKVTK